MYVKIQPSMDSYNLCTRRWTLGLEAKYRRRLPNYTAKAPFESCVSSFIVMDNCLL